MRVWSRVVTAVALLWGAACSYTVGDLGVLPGTCSVDGDCGSGEACVDSACVVPCSSASDCGADEVCEGEVCVSRASSECASAADCDAPGPCELADGASCDDGTCAYVPAPVDTACDDADECTFGERCAAGGACTGGLQTCTDCNDPSQCTSPPGDPLCFESSCTDGHCVYQLLIGTSCEVGWCEAGVAYGPSSCDSDGWCSTPVETRCGGYRCDAAGDACLEHCTAPSECIDGKTCVAGACAHPLADGEACGSPDECGSGRCSNGFCCLAGDCCVDASDCPPAYSGDPVCDDTTGATSCQGTRRVATCVEAVCGSAWIDDDAGCEGVLLRCPGNLRPAECSGSSDQDGLSCASQCAGDSDCADGYGCSSDGTCAPAAGAGQACATSDDCPQLDCENGVCCGSGTCCRDDGPCEGFACNIEVAVCYTRCGELSDFGCPAGTTCASGSCVPKSTLGSPCTYDSQCTTGHCADGVCCESACDAPCQTCAGSDAGSNGNQAAGTCVSIEAGGHDDGPAVAACTAAGDGCAAAHCECSGDSPLGSSTCVGAPCTSNAQCGGDDVCECVDPWCIVPRCSVADCGPCAWLYSDDGGDGLCIDRLGDGFEPVDDPECNGLSSCYGDVGCRLDPGAICAGGFECGSGFCECGDPTCAAEKRQCAVAPCEPCEMSEGGTCKLPLTDGVTCEDGDPCTLADTCTGGQCKGNPKTCGDELDCTRDFCAPEDGACMFQPDDSLCPRPETPCLAAICDPIEGCLEVPVDADCVTDPCLGGQRCQDGMCTGGVVIEICGDGLRCGAEECDDPNGNANEPDTCRTSCTNPTCGDFIVDSGEECDLGVTWCSGSCVRYSHHIDTIAGGLDLFADVDDDGGVGGPGSMAVVWQVLGANGDVDIAMRFFGPSIYVPAGELVPVNTPSGSDQVHPAVAMSGGYGPVVVWEDDSGLTSGGIFLRALSAQADGTSPAPVGTADQTVASNGLFSGEQLWPDIAMADTGAFVVVWVDADPLTPSIRGQYYAGVGTSSALSYGQRFGMATATLAVRPPSVAIAADGSAFVVCTSISVPDFIPHDDVICEAFAAPSSAVDTPDSYRGDGVEPVNVSRSGDQTNPDVAMTATGIVVVWETRARSTDAGSIVGRVVRTLDFTNAASEVVINQRAQVRVGEPRVAADPHNGHGLAVSWTVGDDGDGNVAGRRFHDDLTAAGDERDVVLGSNNQRSAVTINGRGEWVVVYDDDQDVHGVLFQTP